MNIKILSHENAIQAVRADPKQYNVIYITNPGDPFYRSDIHDLLDLSKDHIVFQFQDIEFERYDRSSTNWGSGPQRSHVEDALKFAADKDNFIICCHAGVSRSSATAFVLLCSKMSTKEAVKLLNNTVHDPNNLIVQHGAAVLNRPDMIDIIQEYKMNVQRPDPTSMRWSH